VSAESIDAVGVIPLVRVNNRDPAIVSQADRRSSERSLLLYDYRDGESRDFVAGSSELA